MQKLGALWIKKSKAGNDFLSGEIEIKGVKTLLVAFYNTKKEHERQPDINMYLSEPRSQQETKIDDEHANQDLLNNEEAINPNDIPF